MSDDIEPPCLKEQDQFSEPNIIMCLTSLYQVVIVRVGAGITQTKVQVNPCGELGQFLGLIFQFAHL